jgi:hypothetical protein
MEVASNTTYLQKSAAEMLRVFSNSLAKVLAKKKTVTTMRDMLEVLEAGNTIIAYTEVSHCSAAARRLLRFACMLVLVERRPPDGKTILIVGARARWNLGPGQKHIKMNKTCLRFATAEVQTPAY